MGRLYGVMEPTGGKRRIGPVARLSRLVPLLLLGACDGPRPLQLQPIAAGGLALEEAVRLPRVTGVWRFEGWRGVDTAQVPDGAWGAFQLVTQRLDSVAGWYVAGDSVRWPLTGEVRRDRTVALVAWPSGQPPIVFAGTVAGDTLWLRLATWPSASAWPPGSAVAFVRGASRPTIPPAGATPPRSPTAAVSPPVTVPPRPRPAPQSDTAAAPRSRRLAPPARLQPVQPRDTTPAPESPPDTSRPRRDTARPPGLQPPLPPPPPPPPDTGRPERHR